MLHCTPFAFPAYALPAIVVGSDSVRVAPPGRFTSVGNALPWKSAPALLGSGSRRPSVTTSDSAVPSRLWTWKETDPTVFAGADQVDGLGHTSGLPPLAEKNAVDAFMTCPPPIWF